MYFHVRRCSLPIPIPFPVAVVVCKWLMLIAVILIGTAQSEEYDLQFSNCSHPYMCDPMLGELYYPFWGNNRPQYCGAQPFKLECHTDNGAYSTIQINTVTYRVLEIVQDNYTMKLARNDLWERGACVDVEQRVNTSLSGTPFDNIQSGGDLTLFYGCINDSTPSSPNEFSCYDKEGDPQTGFYTTGVLQPPEGAVTCNDATIVQVPIVRNLMAQEQDPWRQGFIVKYPLNTSCRDCINSGGICGSSNSTSSDHFLCFCQHKSYPQKCPGKSSFDLKTKLIVGFVTASASIIIMLVIFYFYLRRKKTKDTASLLSRNISSDPSSAMMDFEKGNSYLGLGVHLFTYCELEEATNNFDSTKELGDGGFGTVYYGKLKDGRTVAVKRLYEHNYKRVEQFLNEVEILTRLRHQNLVTLYGCTSRHSRELLLVYEYVSNGTVADHLHGERAKPGALPWSTRMKIAVETANALTYLHASDIIHRDVKTNNILLDSNFCVKVADFGLSRLFPNDVTHVSTAPQGTPGYVDPDYHQCYQLTDKSDVYSFGVVLIELISSKPAVDITRHRHEINLSNLAINKIQSKALHELVDPTLGFETDYKVKMMISAVAELAFGCLQGDKDLRPPMVEVFEALKKGIMQTEIYNHSKAEEMDRFPSDGDVLLKSSDAVTLSPDSVTNWSSSG